MSRVVRSPQVFLPRAAWLVAGLLAVLLCSRTATCQDRLEDRPEDRLLVTELRCGCGQALEPTPLQRMQRADGRFPVPGDPRAELRLTAITALALVGDGSTRLRGPYAHSLGYALQWIERHVDAQGRVGFDSEPGWLLVSLMASVVLAEEAAHAPWAARRPLLVRVLEAHAREIAHRRVVDVEVLWWADWMAHALETNQWRFEAAQHAVHWPQAPHPMEPWLDVERLRAAIARHLGEMPVPPAGWRRSLFEELRGEEPELPSRARLIGMAEADPKVCFYVASLAWRRGGPAWQLFATYLGRPLVQRLPSSSNGIPFDEGRAWDMLSAEFYYRYSRLRAW